MVAKSWVATARQIVFHHKCLHSDLRQRLKQLFSDQISIGGGNPASLIIERGPQDTLWCLRGKKSGYL